MTKTERIQNALDHQHPPEPHKAGMTHISPAIIRSESGKLYYNGAALLELAQSTGLVAPEEVVALLGEAYHLAMTGRPLFPAVAPGTPRRSVGRIVAGEVVSP